MQTFKKTQNLTKRRKYNKNNIDNSKYECSFQKCLILQTKQAQYDLENKEILIDLEGLDIIVKCVKYEEQYDYNATYQVTKNQNIVWDYFNFSEIEQELYQLQDEKQDKYPSFQSQFQVQQSQLHYSQNQAIQKAKYDKMNEQYMILQKLLNDKLIKGVVAQMNNRYGQIQAQTEQYFKKMKRQHNIKINELKQIQQQFKHQIEQQNSQQYKNKDNTYSINMKTIERRARLQKEILKLEYQAKRIRQLEQELLFKINQTTQNKKKTLLEQNQKLYNQQKQQNLYTF